MTDASELADRLRMAGHCGLYRAPAQLQERLAQASRLAGLRYYAVNLAGCHDKPTLLSALARDLILPDWFGLNWDALEEALADLGPCVIAIAHLSDLARANQGDLATVTEIFGAVAHEQGLGNTPIWIFVGMDLDLAIPAFQP